jgi:uncharacterized protein YecE (DUF72 family)
MGIILVGTASWTDKTLIDSGRFYPPEAKTPEARLRHYASHFPLVEVDSSYYALPARRTAEAWAERTPDGFAFDVKAFRLFTGHGASHGALPKDLRDALPKAGGKAIYYRDLPDEIRVELWKRFRAGLEPLITAGKLRAVLLQLAPWLVANRDAFDHLRHCREMLADVRLAVELRNKSWFSDKARERVLTFEREQAFAHVTVDEPQGFASSIPQVWEVARSDLGIVRLHGRNREMWTRKGLATSAERFNYLYSTEELQALVPEVRALSERVEELHVLFNNCYEDKAQQNAVQFQQLLQTGG